MAHFSHTLSDLVKGGSKRLNFVKPCQKRIMSLIWLNALEMQFLTKPSLKASSSNSTTSSSSLISTTASSSSSCHSAYGENSGQLDATWWSLWPFWRPWWGGDRAGQVRMLETIVCYNCLFPVSYFAISLIANHKLKILKSLAEKMGPMIWNYMIYFQLIRRQFQRPPTTCRYSSTTGCPPARKRQTGQELSRKVWSR